MSKNYDLIILGSGPAGITAGIYAKRADLDTLLLEKNYVTGGQMLNTYEVDNYPGMPKISGMDLGEAFENHAKGLGLDIRQGEVAGIDQTRQGFQIHLEQETYCARSVIIATGTRPRLLGVPGEQHLAGMGVSYCATCDGAFFKDRTVAVAGGGDTAVEDAIFLSRICRKVYLIHRRDQLRAAKSLQAQLTKLDNVEILWNCEINEIVGDQQVTGVEIYHNKEGRCTGLDVEGVFVAVGSLPNSQGMERVADTDSNGYFIAGEDCQTSVPGIFAAGDIRTKALRQIVTAAADGANAVTSVLRYLADFRK